VSNERPEYLSYLLRMWRVREEGGTRWRASLERPSNGERLAFTSLEAAFDFLRERTHETGAAGRSDALEPPDEPG
jgi:hypothetical protein